jgi:PIN domain nuclease of toxin-antitoxin system
VKPILADASAILAYLGFEPGGEIVDKHLPEITLTAVNLAEIVTVLTLRGVKEDWITTRVLQVFDNILPFDRELAKLAGTLVHLTQKSGLSLGDRACIAAGIVLDARVLTTDAAWKKLNVGIEITLLR